MKMKFVDSEYNCPIYTIIKKTFWLKLIQRTWKKIYKKRREIMKQRMMLHHLRYRELHGRWPQKLHYLPSVYDIKVSF